MGRLDNKVAIITGAAGGIGFGTAQLFAEEGAKVVAADVQIELLEAGIKEINDNGGDAIALKLDVTSPEAWQQVVQETINKYGKIDILVNNAGITLSGKDIKTASLDDWNKVMAVNSTGPFLGMQAVIPKMQENGKGSIINISSIAGIVGGDADGFDIGYSASKGAVRSMTKHSAQALAADSIRVNSVHPGLVMTPLIEQVLEEYPERREPLQKNFPLPPHGVTPRDMGYMILFLASDESSYATGSEFVVDGGFTSK